MNTYTSTRYASISQNLNDIVDALLKNKALLRWLIHIDGDPMSESKEDAVERNMLGNKIVLTKVNEKILTEAEVKLFISPKGGSDSRGRTGVLTDTVFEINIVMPNHLGFLYDLRVDRFSVIASEIAKSLDGQDVTGVGEAKVSPNFNTYKINEEYTGMIFYVSVKNSVMGKLDVDYGR